LGRDLQERIIMSEQFVKVNVKFQKQVFQDVVIDTHDTPLLFKTQLWTLSGVPVERQSIIGFKGGKLKDDADWASVGLKPNMSIMLMGTPGELPKEPVKTDFAEDHLAGGVKASNIASQSQVILDRATGLLNLGNTCYANATIQCLNKVPELELALRDPVNPVSPGDKLFATAFRGLLLSMNKLKSNDDGVSPIAFLTALRAINPQFAERGTSGLLMQQDAEECWSTILSTLSRALEGRPIPGGEKVLTIAKEQELKELANPEAAGSSSTSTPASTSSQVKVRNLIDYLFGVVMHVQDECAETGESVSKYEIARYLKCHISNKVSHLSEGLEEGLNEEIEKHSEKLNKSVTWKRKSKIARLPPYIALNFVRFFWKQTEKVKAKILRPVSFPIDMMDMYNFCTEELKEELKPRREELARLIREEPVAMDTKSDEAVAHLPSEQGANAKLEVEISNAPINMELMNGNYQLEAVLSHIGRSSDSGHYIAWVRAKDDIWLKFDDDYISTCTSEDIKKLSGGGDWHIAYICLYKAKTNLK